MARTTVLMASLLVLLALASCARDWSRQPGQGLAISVAPTEASLGFGESVVFRATVTRSSNDDVTWSASAGSIAGSGETVTYTAPFEAGVYTVTVTSTQDVTQSATATVSVADVPIEEATFEATSGEATWSLGSGVMIGVEAGAFASPTALRVEVYDTPASHLPTGAESIGHKVVVSFDVDALATSGEAAIGLHIPPTASVSAASLEDRQTLLEVLIDLDDGEVFSTIRHYDPTNPAWQSATLGTVLLQSVATDLGVTGSMRIVAQAIDVTEVGPSTGVSTANTTTGLYRIDSDAYSWSSLAVGCEDSRAQVLPAWATPATEPAGREKPAIVLVHGWQVIVNIMAEAGSFWSWGESSFVPAVCGWRHFIEYFHARGLDDTYDLYTFGYDSDLSVESSATLLGTALSAFDEEDVIVIAHSMGGMVTNTHIKQSATRDEPPNVATLLTLGTPYTGSMAIVCLDTDSAGNCAKATVNPDLRRAENWAVSLALDTLQGSVTKYQGSRDLTWDRAFSWTEPHYLFWERERSSVPNEWLRRLNHEHPFQDYARYTSFYGNIATAKSGGGLYDWIQDPGFEALGEVSDGIVTISSATLDSRIPTSEEYVGWNHSQIAGAGDPDVRTDCTQNHTDPQLTKRCTVFSDIEAWLAQVDPGGPEPSITITPAGVTNAEIDVTYRFDFVASAIPASVAEVVFDWSFGDGSAPGSTGSSTPIPVIARSASASASYAYRAAGAYGLVVAARDADTGTVLAQRAATITVGEAVEREYDLSICDTWRAATQGGQGVTTDTWDISAIPPGAVFDIRYDAIRQPDRYFVEYPVGNLVLDTGWRGSQGRYDLNPELYPGGLAGPGAGEAYDIFTRITSVERFLVTVVGPEPETLWDYEVRCRYAAP